MLAASPDGLIGDDTVVEVKCPFTARTKPIDATTIDFLTLDRRWQSNSKDRPQLFLSDPRPAVLYWAPALSIYSVHF